MPNAARLLRRMQQTKEGWGWSDLNTIYTGYGFAKDDDGPHTVYIHPEFCELRATVARHKQLHPAYASTAVKLIRRLEDLQAQQEEEETDE